MDEIYFNQIKRNDKYFNNYGYSFSFFYQNLVQFTY